MITSSPRISLSLSLSSLARIKAARFQINKGQSVSQSASRSAIGRRRISPLFSFRPPVNKWRPWTNEPLRRLHNHTDKRTNGRTNRRSIERTHRRTNEYIDDYTNTSNKERIHRRLHEHIEQRTKIPTIEQNSSTQ